MSSDPISATEEHRLALASRPANPIKAFLLTALLLVTLALMLPVYLLLYPLGYSVRRSFAGLWYRIACWISGLRLIIKGKPHTEDLTMLVSNHVSYLDIPVLGSVTRASFISKSEVATWPLFGILAKLVNTVFIQRQSMKSAEQVALIKQRLLSGESLILFAEGTSSPGSSVLPFKSALFGIIESSEIENLIMQPVTLSYRRYASGQLLSGHERALFGWYGDMELIPHLYAMMGIPDIEIVVTFHDPIRVSEFPDRKALAAFCHQRVLNGLILD